MDPGDRQLQGVLRRMETSSAGIRGMEERRRMRVVVGGSPTRSPRRPATSHGTPSGGRSHDPIEYMTKQDTSPDRKRKEAFENKKWQDRVFWIESRLRHLEMHGASKSVEGEMLRAAQRAMCNERFAAASPGAEVAERAERGRSRQSPSHADHHTPSHAHHQDSHGHRSRSRSSSASRSRSRSGSRPASTRTVRHVDQHSSSNHTSVRHATSPTRITSPTRTTSPTRIASSKRERPTHRASRSPRRRSSSPPPREKPSSKSPPPPPWRPAGRSGNAIGSPARRPPSPLLRRPSSVTTSGRTSPTRTAGAAPAAGWGGSGIGPRSAINARRRITRSREGSPAPARPTSAVDASPPWRPAGHSPPPRDPFSPPRATPHLSSPPKRRPSGEGREWSVRGGANSPLLRGRVGSKSPGRMRGTVRSPAELSRSIDRRLRAEAPAGHYLGDEASAALHRKWPGDHRPPHRQRSDGGHSEHRGHSNGGHAGHHAHENGGHAGDHDYDSGGNSSHRDSSRYREGSPRRGHSSGGGSEHSSHRRSSHHDQHSEHRASSHHSQHSEHRLASPRREHSRGGHHDASHRHESSRGHSEHHGHSNGGHQGHANGKEAGGRHPSPLHHQHQEGESVLSKHASPERHASPEKHHDFLKAHSGHGHSGHGVSEVTRVKQQSRGNSPHHRASSRELASSPQHASSTPNAKDSRGWSSERGDDRAEREHSRSRSVHFSPGRSDSRARELLLESTGRSSSRPRERMESTAREYASPEHGHRARDEHRHRERENERHGHGGREDGHRHHGREEGLGDDSRELDDSREGHSQSGEWRSGKGLHRGFSRGLVEPNQGDRPPWNPNTKTASERARREARRRAVAMAPSIRRAATASSSPAPPVHPPWQPVGKVRYPSPFSGTSSLGSAEPSPEKARRSPGKEVAMWSSPSVEGARGGGWGVRSEAVSARASRAIEFARHGRGDEGLFGGVGGTRGKGGVEHAARLAGQNPEVSPGVAEGAGGGDAAAKRKLLADAEELVRVLQQQVTNPHGKGGAGRKDGATRVAGHPQANGGREDQGTIGTAWIGSFPPGKDRNGVDHGERDGGGGGRGRRGDGGGERQISLEVPSLLGRSF